MKIVVIAPYQKLKQIADTVIKENNFDIECYIGNLEQGLQIARELEAAEPCIFISRGGTAKLIRENLFSQVININISSYDLLEIFNPYINRKDVRIGIVGFNSLLEPARSVCSALGIQAQFFQIHDENEVFQKIDEIQNKHINLIVGDVISVIIVQKYNLNYHLIESSGDSVKDAIEKAMALMDNIQSEMEKLGKIRAIIDSVKDGVLFVDRELKIEQFNMKAREFLLGRFPKDEILKGRSILDFVEKSDLPDVLASKNKSYGKLFHINKNPYVFYSTPILVDGRSEGVVSVFP